MSKENNWDGLTNINEIDILDISNRSQEIYWSDLSENESYKLYFPDVQDIKYIYYKKKPKYIKFKDSILKEGFEDFNENKPASIFFPIKCFNNAWLRCKYGFPANKNKKYSCYIEFKKKSKKKMKIYKREFTEIPEIFTD